MSQLIGNYARYPVYFERGEGSYLISGTGDRYIDFGSGISVINLGHSHPYVVEKLKEQTEKLWHTSNLYHNELNEQLAERISDATFGGKLFFCNSGAEANEAAIKLARIYNNKIHKGTKPRILTMLNGFHGRTYATLSATAQEKVQHGFEPLAPFFTYLPYNDKAALRKELAKGDVCAVMLELWQGESGVIPAEGAYVEELAELAREAEALVIFDEIQTGYGRTGSFFAYQQGKVRPDIITMAKAMANGLPMGAIEAAPELAELFTPGTHGSTFGGNLLASAAAHAVLDIMLAPGFFDSVADKGEAFRQMLSAAFADYDVEIRGRGLLCAVELPGENSAFIKQALEEKLLLVAGGKTAVRFYPPLTATLEELACGVEKAYIAAKKVYG